MKLSIDHNEFMDFIMILLYDVLKSGDYLTKNPRFNKMKESMSNKGIQPLLFNYYLEAPPEIRKKYKSMFKNVLLDDSIKSGTLFIFPSFEEVVEDIVRIVTGKTLNEEKIAKVINKLNGED